ncbi:MAG: DUF3276 family protein [Treponema sp.]|jgi:hypothetical protein|nr:DUF3276 family protein [Treponema sp.]
MGVRGEVFSTKVQLANRTYFFNVKENRMGDLYLNIVESKNRETGGFERQSLVLFADDLSEFLSGFEESLRVMEKATREKKRGGGRSPQRDKAERRGSASEVRRGGGEWRESEARRGGGEWRGDRWQTRTSVRKDKPKPPDDDGSRGKSGSSRVRVVRRKD